MSLPRSALALLVLTGCQAADVQFVCANQEPLCDLLDIVADPRAVATGVDITAVEVNQGAAVPLMSDGEPQESDVGLGVIAGRDALFRVHLTPHEGFASREVTARLFLYDGGEPIGAAQTTAKVTGDAAFDLLVDGVGLVAGADLGWRVQLLEATEESAGVEAAGDAVYPPEDEYPADLELVETLGPLKIVLLPVSYEHGGGTTPSFSDEDLATVTDLVFAMYPATEVQITVADTVHESDFDATSGNDWVSLLSEIASMRNTLGVPSDAYLYGAFDTGDGCAGCYALGLGNLASSAQDTAGRTAIGYWSSVQMGFETMSHEVGHNHGREHVDCGGASSPDAAYPHDPETIGTWGYNLLTGAEYDADAYADLMSYCGPQWVSDYQFDALLDRIHEVNAAFGTTAAARGLHARTWRTVWQLPDGTARWGITEARTEGPSGDPVQVELLDANGAVIGRTEAWFSRLDHAEGGVWRLLEPAAEVVSVRPVTGPLWELGPAARP